MGLRILVLSLWLGGTMFAGAQEVGDTIVLHALGDALSYAEDHNVQRSIYAAQELKAKAEHHISKSYLLPSAVGSFSAQNNLKLATTPIPGELVGRPGEQIDVQFGRDYSYNAGITISQTVLDWQKAMQSRELKLGREIAGVQADIYTEKLTEQVVFYYFTALIARRALEINERDLQLADSIRTLSIQKFDRGLVDKPSLNQAEINFNNVRQSLYSNQIAFDRAVNQLKEFMGLDETVELLMEESYRFADHGFDVPMDLEKDGNITLWELQLEQSELRVREQRSNYYPKLTFTAYFGQQQFQDGFTFSLDGEQWTDYSYLGANLTVPIFTGLANRNKIKASKIDRAIARMNLENETKRSRLRDDLLLREYELGLYASSTAHSNFMLYKDNLELAFQQYQEGILALDSYFRVFEDYLKAENGYLSALSNLYNQYATIFSRKKDYGQ